MARWSASITRSMWRYASRRDGRQARPRRSSERQGRAKRGALLDPQGFDAGKKITGRKRHILVDTLGLLLSVAVHPANIQDRDGVALVLDRRTRRLFPFIERIYGDGGYQGPKAAKAAAKTGCWTIEIVERSPAAVGFEVLPKRWTVERTFAWLSRCRHRDRIRTDRGPDNRAPRQAAASQGRPTAPLPNDESPLQSGPDQVGTQLEARKWHETHTCAHAA